MNNCTLKIYARFNEEIITSRLIDDGAVVHTRPVPQNLSLEFPKYPGSFMLHFDR